MDNAIVRRQLELIQRYTSQLHRSMEDGSYYRQSFLRRRAQVRRVTRLYRKLIGPLGPAKLHTALAAAGTLAILASCTALTGGQPPTVSFVDAVVHVVAGQSVTFTAQALDPEESDIQFTWSVDGEEQSGFTGPTFDYIFNATEDRDFTVAVSVSDGRNDPVTEEITVQVQVLDGIGADGQTLFGAPVTGISLGTDRTFAGAPGFADLDGDGDADLHFAAIPTDLVEGDYDIYNSTDPNNPTFYRVGNSAGSLTTGEAFALTGLSAVEAVNAYLTLGNNEEYVFDRVNTHPAFADVDGDGDLDAVVQTSYVIDRYGPYLVEFKRLRFLENTGSASAPQFSAPSGIPIEGDTGVTGGVFLYGGLTPVDIDGDGDLDFIGLGGVNDPYDETSVYVFGVLFVENVSDSLRVATPDWLIGYSGLYAYGEDATEYLSDSAFMDVDADGDYDLVVALVGDSSAFSSTDTYYAKFRVIPNQGTAAVPDFVVADVAVNQGGLGDSIEVTAIGDLYRPLAIPADVDGDGDTDLVTGVRHSYSGDSGTSANYQGTIIRYTENRDIDFE